MLERALEAIRRRRWERIVVFTGAGVSAESGIPTFRGAGGLWRNFRSEDLATPEAFARDPKTVWEWYEWRREFVKNPEPNAAHRATPALPGAGVVTPKLDGLPGPAAAPQVVE